MAPEPRSIEFTTSVCSSVLLCHHSASSVPWGAGGLCYGNFPSGNFIEK